MTEQKPVNNGAGKGDNPRHLKSKEKFDEGWERIFGAKKCTLNHKCTKECNDKHN